MKLGKEGKVLVKGIDDQHAVVSEGINQVHGEAHRHHHGRNHKAEGGTAADPFFLQKFFRGKELFRGLVLEYEALAEHIVQDQHHHLNQQLADHIRHTEDTAENHHAENLDKHRAEAHADELPRLHKKLPDSPRPALKDENLIHHIGEENGQGDREKVGNGNVNSQKMPENGIGNQVHKSCASAEKDVADGLILKQFFYPVCHLDTSLNRKICP